jgi:hypothetical protein
MPQTVPWSLIAIATPDPWPGVKGASATGW